MTPITINHWHRGLVLNPERMNGSTPMIIIRQYSKDKWKQYWKDKLGIKDYFNIEIMSVKLSPCKHF